MSKVHKEVKNPFKIKYIDFLDPDDPESWEGSIEIYINNLITDRTSISLMLCCMELEPMISSLEGTKEEFKTGYTIVNWLDYNFLKSPKCFLKNCKKLPDDICNEICDFSYYKLEIFIVKYNIKKLLSSSFIDPC
jgi:hypothetical protein